MLIYGDEPFLECSTIGDTRFSPFFARIRSRNNKSIEEIYQAHKILEDGRTNLHWKEAKGKKAINDAECRLLYSILWDEYIEENPELLDVLDRYNGLCDQFGQKGYPCQVTELWRIKNDLTRIFDKG